MTVYERTRNGQTFWLEVDPRSPTHFFSTTDRDGPTYELAELAEMYVRCGFNARKLNAQIKGEYQSTRCIVNAYLRPYLRKMDRLTARRISRDTPAYEKMALRDQAIVALRRYGWTLQKIGEAFDLNKNRVRQIVIAAAESADKRQP